MKQMWNNNSQLRNVIGMLLLTSIYVTLLIISFIEFSKKFKTETNIDFSVNSCECNGKQNMSLEVNITEDGSETNLTLNNINSHGYWMGKNAKRQHAFDVSLAESLVDFFKSENVSSILDLGAGMGNYSNEFMTRGIFTSYYDGNPNTVELTDGRCATADLSKEIHFTKHDWVMSLEVGEHIPVDFENIFLGNLNRLNQHGMIISWAVEGQGGHGHVNNRDNKYLKDKLSAMGYENDDRAESVLRNKTTLPWFKNTIMVFRKKRLSSLS